MKTIIFDIHNTICFQKYSADYFIDTTYTKLSENVDALINYSTFRKTWLTLDIEYHEMTKRGFFALKAQDSPSIDTNLREIPHIKKMQTLLSRLGIDPQSNLPKVINDHFQKYWIKGLILYPFTMRVLQDLSSYRLGVVSNFREAKWLYIWLDHQDLSKFFHNNIIISEEVGYRKPNPVLFTKILERMNLIASESIFYVGDNELEDSLGAQLVGIKPLIIGKDIGSIEDLPSLLS